MSHEPGTPLGRLKGLAKYASEHGLCTGIEAKPAELFLIDEIERLRGENDDLKAALDVWNSSELGLMIAKLRAALLNLYNLFSKSNDFRSDSGPARDARAALNEEEMSALEDEVCWRLQADNAKLRDTIKWLRDYINGHTVYGLPHALEKIDTALNEETK